ncbi:MAG TPA: LLM class flavin-dependent oxidoreductase [Blastocatellia bacterium]|nr:LLM class flavin-dependent oxidoreductase [Blastocatellia bacterium]
MSSQLPIDVFSTCPQSSAVDRDAYLQNVIDVARWSEQSGCRGILVYTDNSLVDPWLVAQIIIESTEALCPLVAIQPVYMHPYSVAKMVASLGHIYGRRVYLNMVAGGFRNDLAALNDTTEHDRRYDRLVEYTTIIRSLLENGLPVSYTGDFYKVDKLRMTPPLPPELFPGVFVSGSSEAGLAAAEAMGATAIKYPKPAHEYLRASELETHDSGVRVGIVTREDSDEAWRVARDRFPEDRKGQVTHQLAMKVSDSVWHKQLSELGEEEQSEANPYWLVPFNNYKTFCPYLVGSYRRVADELSRYISVGYRTFILDIPPNQEELHHINAAFSMATEQVKI